MSSKGLAFGLPRILESEKLVNSRFRQKKNSKVNGRDTDLSPSESTDEQQNLRLAFKSYGKAAESSTKGMTLEIFLKKGKLDYSECPVGTEI